MSKFFQTEVLTLDSLVTLDHIYRKFKELWDFDFLGFD